MKLSINCVEYGLEENESVIYLFGRDENRERKMIRVPFQPYFYTRKVAPSKTSGETNLSIFSQPLVKIKVQTPEELKSFAKKFKHLGIWEADIPLPLRFLIDSGVRSGVEIKGNRLVPTQLRSDQRVQYIDIEVLSEKNEFPDPTKAARAVISITVYDTYLKKYIIFHVSRGQKIHLKRADVELRPVKTETRLLRDFSRFVAETDPDIITGWNIEKFDIPYLFNRLDFGFYEGLSSLRTIERVKGKIHIKGRVIFDLLSGYRKLIGGEMEEYSLDYVSKKELGFGKIQLSASFKELWEKNLTKLLEYNLRDVKLTRMIDEKLGIINFFDELRCLVGCTFDNVLYNSKIVDILCLRQAKKMGMVLPSPRLKQKVKSYEAALVFDPTVGLHQSIVVVDLKELYPRIIKAFNISPETFSPKGQIIIDKDHKFLDEPKGLIPSVLEELMNLREEKQKLMAEASDAEMKKKFNREQTILKGIINSFYGVLGFPKFRLYNPKIAEAITAVGRKILGFTKRFVEEEMGLKVIYGDTDSVFICLQDRHIDTDTAKLLQRAINEKYMDFAEAYGIKERGVFQVKVEEIYSNLIIVSKKRYAGLLIYEKGEPIENPKLKIKGLEAIKSNSARVTRVVQKGLLELIFRGADKERVRDFIVKWIDKVTSGKVPSIEIGIPSKLTKSLSKYKVKSAHVKAVEYSNEHLGTNYEKGDKPKIVYIKSVPSGFPSTKVIAFDENTVIPEGFQMDWEKMVERIVGAKGTRDILEIAGIPLIRTQEE